MSIAANLPSGWDSYSAADKIDYFNDAGITGAELAAAGVSQGDIEWMMDNGFQYGSTAPSYTGGAYDVEIPSYLATGTVTSNLPQEWDKYSAEQKIDYFNENKIRPTQLLAEGVPQAVIDWMIGNGYSGMGPDGPSKVPGSAYTTTGSLTSNLPSGWGAFTSDQKIQYFNDNKITPGQLLAEGVPQADIEWMLDNGYTGGNPVKPANPNNPLQPGGTGGAGGAGGGGTGGLSGSSGNLSGTGQDLGYSQTQYNPTGGAQSQMPVGAYQSNLIQSLRSRNTSPMTSNPGFTLYQTAPVGQSNTFQPPSNSGNAFNPQPTDMPEYDPTSIFKDVYGRDPTPAELNDTKGMSPDDLRTTLEKSFAAWEAAQKGQQGQQDLPFDPFAFTQNAIKENTGMA